MRRVFDRGRYRRSQMTWAIILTAALTTLYWLLWIYVYNQAYEQARAATERVIEAEAERFERCHRELQGLTVESRLLLDELMSVRPIPVAGECTH